MRRWRWGDIVIVIMDAIFLSHGFIQGFPEPVRVLHRYFIEDHEIDFVFLGDGDHGDPWIIPEPVGDGAWAPVYLLVFINVFHI